MCCVHISLTQIKLKVKFEARAYAFKLELLEKYIMLDSI